MQGRGACRVGDPQGWGPTRSGCGGDSLWLQPSPCVYIWMAFPALPQSAILLEQTPPHAPFNLYCPRKVLLTNTVTLGVSFDMNLGDTIQSRAIGAHPHNSKHIQMVPYHTL